jgi:hypothetical protein
MQRICIGHFLNQWQEIYQQDSEHQIITYYQFRQEGGVMYSDINIMMSLALGKVGRCICIEFLNTQTKWYSSPFDYFFQTTAPVSTQAKFTKSHKYSFILNQHKMCILPMHWIICALNLHNNVCICMFLFGQLYIWLTHEFKLDGTHMPSQGALNTKEGLLFHLVKCQSHIDA